MTTFDKSLADQPISFWLFLAVALFGQAIAIYFAYRSDEKHDRDDKERLIVPVFKKVDQAGDES